MPYPLQQLVTFPLFRQIDTGQLEPMLSCLGAQVKECEKGKFLALSREQIPHIGIILSGEIHMLYEDRWGDKAVLADLYRGDLFGESFACGLEQHSLVEFQAVKRTAYLLLPFHKVLHACSNACPFHFQLIENMIFLLAAKNQKLMEKLVVVSKKSLRKKILAYLSRQAEKAASSTITLPLSRTQLADYLCADRTAVARELAKMQADGLITVSGRTVTLR